jgi:hypothetical protein
LELPKLALRLIIATIIVALGGKLGELLKCGEASLALGTCGFTILKHEPQHLRHVGLRRWGGLLVLLAWPHVSGAILEKSLACEIQQQVSNAGESMLCNMA